MEIAENVHRVDDTSGSNCILLLDKNIAVVDTGNPGNAQTIVDYVKSIGRKPEDCWFSLGLARSISLCAVL